MAHHQHHGAEYEAQVSRSLQSRPTSTTLPAISEDELVADADEPPDPMSNAFRKTNNYPFTRRESLITRSLHTDSESHDDDHHVFNSVLNHVPSVSSTASTHSIRSTGDFTSDDGIASQGTRPSTPGSPRSASNLSKLDLHMKAAVPKQPAFIAADKGIEAGPAPEKSVEEQLGRKRCITFACGRKVKEDAHKLPVLTTTKPAEEGQATRPACAIKFSCPFKPSKGSLSASKRHLSPAPLMINGSALHKQKTHRDSDSTVKMISPKPASASPRAVRRIPSRRLEAAKDDDESLRFHEFASDEEREIAVDESSASSKHLTVDDTLQQEYAIRKRCEEAAAAEGEDDDDVFPDTEDDDDDDDDELDDESDEGFQTDDEDGFAESDDEDDDSDSDYDWWNVGRGIPSPATSPFTIRGARRRSLDRSSSHSSLADTSSAVSPVGQPIRKTRNKTKPISVRPGTPELPDSTDFVCGTFDEDKPMEQAYKSCIKQREAAKQQQYPQDIDPSFPTSDPELESDEEKDEEVNSKKKQQQREVVQDEPRGRRMDNYRRPSPGISPVRRRSPPPKKLFGHLPIRAHSPPPTARLTSPPPSRRGSMANDAATNGIAFGHAFFSDRREITHTASLPRSPHPLLRRRMSPKKLQGIEYEDDGEETEQPVGKYRRGAIDIVQGLEQKRLKRRQKFHEKYRLKGEKKRSKKPLPGKGAQRMRQVGLDCAVFRGARVLSI